MVAVEVMVALEEMLLVGALRAMEGTLVTVELVALQLGPAALLATVVQEAMVVLGEAVSEYCFSISYNIWHYVNTLRVAHYQQCSDCHLSRSTCHAKHSCYCAAAVYNLPQVLVKAPTASSIVSCITVTQTTTQTVRVTILLVIF
jgi:hypothetical protein